MWHMLFDSAWFIEQKVNKRYAIINFVAGSPREVLNWQIMRGSKYDK